MAWLDQNHLEDVLQSTDILVLPLDCLIQPLLVGPEHQYVKKKTHSDFHAWELWGQGRPFCPTCPIGGLYPSLLRPLLLLASMMAFYPDSDALPIATPSPSPFLIPFFCSASK